MTCEVWDKKRQAMVKIDEEDRLIAYKRDDYGKKVLVEPVRFTGATSKHFKFVTDSGMDILVNKEQNDDSVDCFYSNKNNWSISLNKYEAFEELI